jgi:two-component system cell cycle response regulator
VRDALDTARSDRPDVILLDITLHDEDGLAVLADLARTGDLPHVSVALTGHDDPALHTRCLDAGCVDVLIKPINAMELPGRIRGWLGGQD